MQNNELPKRKFSWLRLILDIVKVGVGYLAALIETTI